MESQWPMARFFGMSTCQPRCAERWVEVMRWLRKSRSWDPLLWKKSLCMALRTCRANLRPHFWNQKILSVRYSMIFFHALVTASVSWMQCNCAFHEPGGRSNSTQQRCGLVCALRRPGSSIQMSNVQNLGWLMIIGDYTHTHTNQYVGDCHIPLENPFQPTSIKRGHRVLNTAQIGLSENREPRNPFICLFIIIFRQILHNLSSKLSPDWLGPWVACAVWQLDQATPGFIAIIENGKLLGKACTALAWAWLKMVRQSG